jgi:hypothetical protein
MPSAGFSSGAMWMILGLAASRSWAKSASSVIWTCPELRGVGHLRQQPADVVPHPPAQICPPEPVSHRCEHGLEFPRKSENNALGGGAGSFLSDALRHRQLRRLRETTPIYPSIPSRAGVETISLSRERSPISASVEILKMGGIKSADAGIQDRRSRASISYLLT